MKNTHAHHIDKIQSELTRDPKGFWRYIKSNNRPRRSKITKNGNILPDSQCAKELALFFQSVYDSRVPELNVDAAIAASGAGSARVHIGRVQLYQVERALDRLKPKRSAGPDGLPAFMIRDGRALLAEPLLYIFNLCIQTSYFPVQWKVSRVVPVPRADKVMM